MFLDSPYKGCHGLLWWRSSKESACNARNSGNADLIPGRGNHNPLQYFCLENPMDRGAWQVTGHRVAKSQTQLKQLSTAQDIKDAVRCFCFSVWLCSVWQSLGPAILLQMALFHFLMDEYFPFYILIHTTAFYPFLCQWTFRLLPCLGYCK